MDKIRSVWQSDFHDRALRYVESLREAGFYIINNPVRANLAEQWWDYPPQSCREGKANDLRCVVDRTQP